MGETTYQAEWLRQLARKDIPALHLPVHRWYLTHPDPASVEERTAPREDLTFVRAHKPSIEFYRFLYHSAGEEYLWGDRRRMSNEQLLPLICQDTIHIVVMYAAGVPAGFFELSFRRKESSNLKYFALLPGFQGGGMGSTMLNRCIRYAASQQAVPLSVDTCTLDHPIALENYRNRGFVFDRGEDEIYPDPRLDGTVPPHAGKHVPRLD